MCAAGVLPSRSLEDGPLRMERCRPEPGLPLRWVSLGRKVWRAARVAGLDELTAGWRSDRTSPPLRRRAAEGVLKTKDPRAVVIRHGSVRRPRQDSNLRHPL